MRKLFCITASLLLMSAPATVMAEKSPTTGDEDQPAKIYDPCATSNPALAGKGCLYYLNGQIVTANGDGTFTTSAGNRFDANGNLISKANGTAAAVRSNVPNTGDTDNTTYGLMMGTALIVMAGAGYVLLATDK